MCHKFCFFFPFFILDFYNKQFLYIFLCQFYTKHYSTSIHFYLNRKLSFSVSFSNYFHYFRYSISRVSAVENTAVTIWKTTLISSRAVDSGVTRVICGRVDDRKRKPDRRISIYNLFFPSRDFYHAKLFTYSLSDNRKTHFAMEIFRKFIQPRRLLRTETVYRHVRKYLRAKTNINYLRLDSRGGQHNPGLSGRILFSSQLSHQVIDFG